MTQLQKQINELRDKGYSYRQIQKELGCSKSTICYNLGEGQKAKNLKRSQKHRKQNILLYKYYTFISPDNRHKGTAQINRNRTIKKILIRKVRQFSFTERIKGKHQMCKHEFNYKDLLDKIGDNPTCYLTGRPIDLTDGESYHLDHILPRSQGGSNSLDNCGLTCAEANQAKGKLSVDEFLALCKEVVNHSK